MTARYDSMLHAVMQKRIVVILFAVIVFASLPLLFKFIPSELAPSEDKASWRCWGRPVQRQPGLHRKHHGGREQESWTTSRRSLTPQVFSGVFNANQAFGIASMVPWSQREASQKEVLDRVAGLVKDIPGMAITTFQFPELPGRRAVCPSSSSSPPRTASRACS